METRQPWLSSARKQHYRTLPDWVDRIRELGWDIPESTVRNWEASGFLPTSLDYRATNLIAESLHMTVNEMLRCQGFNIVGEVDGITIPSSAIGHIKEIGETENAILDEIMPAVHAQFEILRDHMKKYQSK
jgi:hypothetical protein